MTLCRYLLSLFLVALVLWSTNAYAMKPLTAPEMASVTGQDGVALELEFRMNANDDGSPLTICNGLGSECRLALQFANRGSGGGEWLALKNVYGTMEVSNLYLDGTQSMASAVNGDTALFDASRFSDESGDCLFGAGNCNASYVGGLPALVLSIPGSTGVQEIDLQWGFTVDGLAIEYGPNGHSNNGSGSAIGIRMGHNSGANAPARYDLDGKLLVFGF